MTVNPSGTFADPIPANQRVCPRCNEGELYRPPPSLVEDLFAAFVVTGAEREVYDNRCFVYCETCGWEGTSEALGLVAP